MEAPSGGLAAGRAGLAGVPGRPAQEAMLADVLAVMEAAPPFHPRHALGQGHVGRHDLGGAVRLGSRTGAGYRYEERHPEGCPGRRSRSRCWRLGGRGAGRAGAGVLPRQPYRGRRAMGLHQDRDEADFSQPVVSSRWGDEALFRVGARSGADPRSPCGCGPATFA
jgi:alkylated DNA repair protein (DNA oxidative demethylase)